MRWVSADDARKIISSFILILMVRCDALSKFAYPIYIHLKKYNLLSYCARNPLLSFC